VINANTTVIEVVDFFIKVTINKENITCTKIPVCYSRVLESKVTKISDHILEDKRERICIAPH
jgi:hypothetical protein